MPDFLVFTLYGGMASFGAVAVGEVRPTFDRPSKSAVFGLVAAALGLRRDQEEALSGLTRAFDVAVVVRSGGTPLRDYHSVQTPTTEKRGRRFISRRDEVSGSRHDLNTLLTYRDYWCDASYEACLVQRDQNSPFSLQQVRDALLRPVFPLYLGRKSCPLSLPLAPEIIPAETIEDAVSKYPGKGREFVRVLETSDTMMIGISPGVPTKVSSFQRVNRRDELHSRSRWQYVDREEDLGTISR
jgi:CRISPR system Cascade subunit CasD